jgi:hypothetical protein
VVRYSNMTPEEGWHKLRSRLPDMNRTYLRQRATAWIIVTIAILGIAAIILAGFQIRAVTSARPHLLQRQSDPQDAITHNFMGTLHLKPTAPADAGPDPKQNDEATSIVTRR